MKLGTPQTLGPHSYFGGSTEIAVMNHYPHTYDLNGDGVKEIIMAGFESQASTPWAYTNTSVRIFSWRAGKLVDVTQQWLPDGIDRIEGTGDIVFGDYNGDGRTDMFMAGNTDMEHPANTYVFYNQGSSFTRGNLGSEYWKHGADSADINGDGYWDVLATGYHDPKIYLGGASGMRTLSIPMWGDGSGVALGDFLGNGRIQAVMIDNFSPWQRGGTSLYVITSDYRLEPHSNLPTPRLELEQYRHLNVGSHDVSALAWDFNQDGKLDVLVMSRAFAKSGPNPWINVSQLQFLENRGDGKFVDVTEQRLVNWDINTFVGYAPVIGDFDQDGDDDIFLSHAGDVSSTRILFNDNGVFTDTGLDVFGSVMAGWDSIGTISQDDQGQWHFLVDTLRYTVNGSLSTMKAYPLLFDSIDPPVNDIAYKTSSVWGGGVMAYNAGSPKRSGDGEFIPIQGKNCSVEVYQGTNGYDRLLGTQGDDALFLDDLLSAFHDNKPQARIVDIEEISMGDGHDIVDLTSNQYSVKDIKILGGNGDDVIWSSQGNDVLSGGQGQDTIWGGAGKDVFLFTSFDSQDIIKDFQVGEDRIAFDLRVFNLLDDDLSDNISFDRNNRDRDDFLLYENGILYYDRNGSDPGDMVAIAKFIGAPELDPSYFFLM